VLGGATMGGVFADTTCAKVELSGAEVGRGCLVAVFLRAALQFFIEYPILLHLMHRRGSLH
jgi:hypothetical protein